jgi:hypothetical protein
MAGELLLTLKEIPSFEGELSIRLMEERDSEGRASYPLVCEKKPPLDPEEVPLIVGVRSGAFGDGLDFKEINKSIGWQRDIPPVEAREILDTVESQFDPLFRKSSSG